MDNNSKSADADVSDIPQTSELDNLIRLDKEVFTPFTTDLYSSWKPIVINEAQPVTAWRKNKISSSIWNDIKNICAWTYLEHKSECMIRLYWEQDKSEWGAILHPQEMSGMTVSDELDVDLIVKDLGHGNWAECGSVHHHCSTDAFQSSTDESDEADLPGLHITLGKLDAREWNIHSRFKNPECFLEPMLDTFFELPDWLLNIPANYRDGITSKFLCTPGTASKARKDWISRIIEKKPVYGTSQYWMQNTGKHYARDTYGKPSATSFKSDIEKVRETIEDLIEVDEVSPSMIKLAISSPKDKLEPKVGSKTSCEPAFKIWDKIRTCAKDHGISTNMILQELKNHPDHWLKAWVDNTVDYDLSAGVTITQISFDDYDHKNDIDESEKSALIKAIEEYNTDVLKDFNEDAF